MPMRRNYTLTLTLSVLLLLASTSMMRGDDGRGVIREANPLGASSLEFLFPLFCGDAACARLNSLLFPTLFTHDPHTGVLIGAKSDNRALALEPTLQEGNVQTLHLRDDL